jgi:hypothetical protein
MSDEKLVRLRPYDLAGVWGKAVGQVIGLWRDLLMSLFELGAAEDPTLVGDHVERIEVRAAGGPPLRLSVRELVGETFQERIDGRLVRFEVAGAGGPGVVLVECRVEQPADQYIRGDIYVGDVVDERGALVKRISLDAGS